MAALRCGRHRPSNGDGDGMEFRTPDAGRQRRFALPASEFFVRAGYQCDRRLISGKNEAYHISAARLTLWRARLLQRVKGRPIRRRCERPLYRTAAARRANRKFAASLDRNPSTAAGRRGLFAPPSLRPSIASSVDRVARPSSLRPADRASRQSIAASASGSSASPARASVLDVSLVCPHALAGGCVSSHDRSARRGGS